jgi:serine/threonine protein kinase
MNIVFCRYVYYFYIDTNSNPHQQLSHRNIVHLLDHFTTPDYYGIVLDFVQGKELFEIIAFDYSSLDTRSIKSIFKQIVSGTLLCRKVREYPDSCQREKKALGYMHARNISHRDLKAENILITPIPSEDPSSHSMDYKVTLIDFGFARQVDPSAPLMDDNCGSPQYASPEVIMCQPYDPRQADIWSLGVILFTLATGELPFRSLTSQGGQRKMFHRIARGDYSFPSEINVDDNLKDLIKTLLVTKPSVRPSTEQILNHPWLQESQR